MNSTEKAQRPCRVTLNLSAMIVSCLLEAKLDKVMSNNFHIFSVGGELPFGEEVVAVDYNL